MRHLGGLAVLCSLAGCGALSPLSLGADGSAPALDFGALDAGSPRDLGLDLPPRDLGTDAPPDLGPSCDVVALGLHLRVELACTGGSDTSHRCPTTTVRSASATLGGDPSQTYVVHVRERGVVDSRTVVGGTTSGSWNEGGSSVPSDTGPAVWAVTTNGTLTTPGRVYSLNVGDSATPHVRLVDETHDFRAEGGAIVTLHGQTSAERLLRDNHDAAGVPVVVPGVPPAPSAFDGQFVQLDVVSVDCP